MISSMLYFRILFDVFLPYFTGTSFILVSFALSSPLKYGIDSKSEWFKFFDYHKSARRSYNHDSASLAVASLAQPTLCKYLANPAAAY